jgi:uncharacterized protein
MGTDNSQAVVDGLTNLLSGMGTRADKTTFSRFHFRPLTQQQIDSAYRSDWIARKVIDIPAQDATREWRSWEADKEDIGLLEDAEEAVNLQKKLKTALQRARLYGGGAIVMGVGSEDPSQPLLPEKVKKGDLRFVHAVSRWELPAGPLDLDVTSEFYGEPAYYTTQDGRQRVHPSRVVRLIGLEQPALHLGGDGWGDPVLQIVHDAIIACGTVSQAVATMIQELKVDVISVPDLTANMADAKYEERLKKRFGLAADAKSIYDMLILDKEETWQRLQVNLNGLDQIIILYMMLASGAADIPATRFLGQPPRGMNATGDSDTRNYYDLVKTAQKTEIGPALNRLDEVLIRSTLGARPPELGYDWRPLWQMDDAQKADVAQKKASTFKVDVDAGLIPPEVLGVARVNQLIEDGTYPGLESAVDDWKAGTLEGLTPDGGVDPNSAEGRAAAAMAARVASGQPDPSLDPGNNPDPTEPQGTEPGGPGPGKAPTPAADAVEYLGDGVADYNPNHDPSTGEFSGDGAGLPGPGGGVTHVVHVRTQETAAHDPGPVRRMGVHAENSKLAAAKAVEAHRQAGFFHTQVVKVVNARSGHVYTPSLDAGRDPLA